MSDKNVHVFGQQCCIEHALEYKKFLKGDNEFMKSHYGNLEIKADYKLIRSMMHNLRICRSCRILYMQCNICDDSKWARHIDVYDEIKYHLTMFHFNKLGSVAYSSFVNIPTDDLFDKYTDVAEQFAYLMLASGEGAAAINENISIYFGHILHALPQLSFINVDNMEKIRMEILGALCEDRNGMVTVGKGDYAFGVLHNNFASVVELISRSICSCIMCGEEFDSSPPSIEMVAKHYRECTTEERKKFICYDANEWGVDAQISTTSQAIVQSTRSRTK